MAAKTLIVLRHAKSSWKTQDPDIRRPLAERGRRDAVAAGSLLAAYDIDVVLCSSAARAQQTWQAAQSSGATARDVRVSEAIYHAWPGEIITELNELPEESPTALVIGHEPTLSGLIGTLAKPSDLLDQVEARFPTSGLAVLTYRGAWKTLGPGKATLKLFEVPRG